MAKIEIGSIEIKGGSTSESDSKARVKSATERKASATETIEEAWARIMQTKSYRDNKAKLDAVKKAMDAGEIGREPVEEGKKQKKFSAAEAKRLYNVIAERKKEETLRTMVEETPANYSLITTEEQLAKLAEALRSEPEIAVDTETTGVDVYTDIIVGISFSLPTISLIPSAELGWHVYIPVAHDEGEQLSRDYVLSELKDILYSETIGKVLHNAMFDIAMLRRHGSDLIGVIWDTQTAMHLLNENEPSFKLKDLAPLYLGVDADTFGELFGKDAKFNEMSLDLALVYAAKDTELTWRLYEFQRKHMERYPSILEYYQTVEVPLLYVIVELEANGYILDLDFAEEYRDRKSVV